MRRVLVIAAIVVSMIAGAAALMADTATNQLATAGLPAAESDLHRRVPATPITVAPEPDPVPALRCTNGVPVQCEQYVDGDWHPHQTPPPPPAPEPVPVVAANPAPAPLPSDPAVAAQLLLEQHVPARWRELVPVTFTVIGGCTSYAQANFVIETTECQRRTGHFRWTVVHEWGHQVAIKYGNALGYASGPTGFASADPEVWADCVANIFTAPGMTIGGSRDLCQDPNMLEFARAFLAAPPAS